MSQTDGKPETFDSDRQYIGTVYAKALLGAAEKSGSASQVLDEFDSLVVDVLDKLPKLDAALSSSRVATVDKVEILKKAFQGKMSQQLLHFVNVVVEHGRFDCLRAINRVARTLYNKSRGRVDVKLRTANPVDSQLLESLANRLKAALGRDIELTTSVDPDLIGGIEVRVGDTVYDGSIRNRLKQLRSTAVERAAQKIRDALHRFALTD